MQQQHQINHAIQILPNLSGQRKVTPISEIEHSYAKAWYIRPNNQKVHPTRYLFLKNYPRHFISSHPFGVDTGPEGILDVGSVDDLRTDSSPQSSAMIDKLIENSQQEQLCSTTEEAANTLIKDQTIDTRTWTQQMERLYFKTCRVLQNDYLTRLVYESSPSESLHRLNLMEYTSIQLRHLFANIAGWDADLLQWLHSLLTTENENHTYLIHIYHQVMQYLRSKLPTLIDKFYPPVTKLHANQISLSSTNSSNADDPVAKLLIKNKAIPKRLPGGPIFIIVPSGPNMTAHQFSARKEFWKLMFSSLGQLINVNVSYRPDQTSIDTISIIKASIRDKIRELRRKKSNETRPIVLVGFNHGSMLAIHCALENPGQINAIICLGFPLATIGGVRGGLDDPLLDMTVPILFVVGLMSSTTNLEDMERFRELMARAETGLVVVGGANDRLVLCYKKKLSDGVTQVMADRCIGDEIYDFLNNVLNPRSEPAKLRLDLS